MGTLLRLDQGVENPEPASMVIHLELPWEEQSAAMPIGTEEYNIIFGPVPMIDHIVRTDQGWKPPKDLVRIAANRERDGRPVEPQIQPGQCYLDKNVTPYGPFAMCRITHKDSAKRAFGLIGGSLWHEVRQGAWLILCKEGQDAKCIDSWENYGPQDVQLDRISPINSAFLRRVHPSASTIQPALPALTPNGTFAAPLRMQTSPSFAAISLRSPPNVSKTTPYMQSNAQPVAYQPMVDPYQNQPHQAFGCAPGGPNAYAWTSQPMLTMIPWHTMPPVAAPIAPLEPVLGAMLTYPLASKRRGAHLGAQLRSNPLAPPTSYHQNPDGTPINTSNGAISVGSSRAIVVRNLSHKIYERELCAHFSGAGFIESYKLGGGGSGGDGANSLKCTAVLTYRTTAEARAAVTRFNGKSFHGRRVRVEMARDDSAATSTAPTWFGESDPGAKEGRQSSVEGKKGDPAGKAETRETGGPIIANGSEGDDASVKDLALKKAQIKMAK